jgi:hypothetical protein
MPQQLKFFNTLVNVHRICKVTEILQIAAGFGKKLHLIKIIFMKILLYTLAVLFYAHAAYGQKISGSDVPAQVKKAFNTRFAEVKTAKWSKEKSNYEAEFIVSGNEMSLLFDGQGTLLETETEMSVSALPQPVRDACAAAFPGKKIKEAAKIVGSNGTVRYEAQVDRKDYLFDAQGKKVE